MLPKIRIQAPAKFFPAFNLKEIWDYRELIGVLVKKEIKIRYKQTFLGITWLFARPIVSVVVFSFIFGRLAKIPSEGLPYPVFAFTGIIFWNYFASSFTNSSNAILNNSAIIKKIYFPRLIFPITASLVSLVDFGVAASLFAFLLVIFKITPLWTGLLYLPILLFICFLTATGLGMFFSSFNVRYKDVKQIVPILSQFLMYATPVVYPPSLIKNQLALIFKINPMAGVIGTARAVILGSHAFDLKALALAFGIALALFVVGAYRFKKVEQAFADHI